MKQDIKQSDESSSENAAGDTKNKNIILILKWAISILVPVIILMIPETGTFTPTIKVFLAVTFWGVFCMATEIIPITFVAIMLPVFYILTNIATPAQAFGPWTTNVIWVVFGGIILAHVLMTSGLSTRIAYFTIIKSGGSFTGILIGIALAGVIINPFVPSLMAKVAMISPIAVAVCIALNLEKKTKAASAVMLAAFLGLISSRLGFLTGEAGIPMSMNLVADVTGYTVSWAEYAYHNLLLSLIFTMICITIVIVVLRPEKVIEGKEGIVEKYKELGPIKPAEKKVIGLLIMATVVLLTDSIHGISPAWIFMVIGLITFLPGINLMNDEQLGKLNFKILFLVAGCMAIGSVANISGTAKWMADILAPLMAGTSPLQTIIMSWLFGALSIFVLTPLPALGSLPGPLAEIALQLDMNPLPIVYAFIYGTDQYILPYIFPGLLFIYSFGYISMKSLMMVFIPRLIASGLFIILVAYPYWRLIGLL